MLLLAACTGEASAGKQTADDRVVAQVQAINDSKPPARPIAPEPILFADIQKFDLFGAGCAFAPGGSMGAVFLTREKTGYLKLEGELVRFAPDPGSAKMPLGTVWRHTGKALAASLTRTEAGEDGVRFPGRLTVTDASDRVVYEEDGLVQCGA